MEVVVCSSTHFSGVRKLIAQKGMNFPGTGGGAQLTSRGSRSDCCNSISQISGLLLKAF